MLAHVYRLINQIIPECWSMKIDSDKAVQSESLRLLQGYLLASGNYWLLYLLAYKGEHARVHTYYFLSYRKFISMLSDLSFAFRTSAVQEESAGK